MDKASISETARLVADSAFSFAKNSKGVQRARAMRDKPPDLDLNVWHKISELGWIGVRAAEQHGGLGLNADAVAALLESIGKMIVPEPVVPAIAAASLLSECATESALKLLKPLLSGKQLCIPVKATEHASEADSQSDSQADFELLHVPDCYRNAQLLVARGAGESFEIRAVDSKAAGVLSSVAVCVDGSTLSTCVIKTHVWKSAAIVAQGSSARTAFDRATDTMLLGYSAYLVGLMQGALQIALEYMKVRSQFGTPIGAFQALQHRAASCHVDALASRALLYEAARAFEAPSRARAVSAIKARASAAALRVTKECVQFHGAIGFADEHDIGLYLKRAMTIAARQGGQAKQNARYFALMQESH
jgi:alkylation response protein AidB-like acyl-CoA dehydrogenase